MKLFSCGYCGQPLMFENTVCVRCKHRLGYDSKSRKLIALDDLGGLWAPAAAREQSLGQFRFCDNAAWNVCNWLVPAESAGRFCLACRHNRMIPDVNDPEKLRLWTQLEAAKHRLFYTLMQLDLPTFTRSEDPEEGLAFDFLMEDGSFRVLTGHDHGLVTLNAREADDPTREMMRQSMGERYRTLLGHFRHEIGHYYWDRLVRSGPMLAECRALFGDESADYEEALKRHYAEGSPANWADSFVSPYATSHPWEDFAETFAHYLHICDSLETARAFGLSVHANATETIAADAVVDPYSAGTIEEMTAVWAPICFAINCLNRGMGQPDLYPFVLSPGVVEKLGFVHRLVHSAESKQWRPAPLEEAAA